MKKQIKIHLVILFMASINLFAQQNISLIVELKDMKMEMVNREISPYPEDPNAVEMNANNSSGLGVLEDVHFDKGTIEIDLKGENNPGKSFIGIAFNIQNNETYEAVYFRPFNFVAEEQIRKEHMVQYIYHPEFTWRKLREERTGAFENEIPSPPNPDTWFKAKIKISDEKVDVFINGISEPVLSIDRLTSSKSKKIGIWTGYGSSGRFKNLVLRPE